MGEGLSGEWGGRAICSGVCNSHEVCPIASSIDAKSYFLAIGQTSCKAIPPLLRLFECDCNKSINQMRIFCVNLKANLL